MEPKATLCRLAPPKARVPWRFFPKLSETQDLASLRPKPKTATVAYGAALSIPGSCKWTISKCCIKGFKMIVLQHCFCEDLPGLQTN